MSIIPKFDVNTGILTSKDKKRTSDQKAQMAPIKIKREQNELSHSESEHSTESPYTTSSELSTYSMVNQYQTDTQNYMANQIFIQYQPQQDDYYYDPTMMHYYSTQQDYIQHDQISQIPLTQATLPIELVDNKPEYYQLTNVQNTQQWNDNSTLLDSISPLISTYPTLPSFNTFLNA